MTDETRKQIADLLVKELSLRTVIPYRRPGQGFRSFSEFKRIIGSAGTGYAWHHIVGQTTSNLHKFGSESIHNTGNLVKLEHGKDTIHQEITNFYNSIQSNLTESDSLTVREWVGNQSFEEQQDFGIRVIKVFGGTV